MKMNDDESLKWRIHEYPLENEAVFSGFSYSLSFTLNLRLRALCVDFKV